MQPAINSDVTIGEAMRYAQIRLAPARLTHAMRWLGAASRARRIALEHAKTRTAFGAPIIENQGVGTSGIRPYDGPTEVHKYAIIRRMNHVGSAAARVPGSDTV